MSIDDILAGTDTVMTKELVRLFKIAGCSPTACHACLNEIKPGDTFKLVTFKRKDEMCCALHGKADLSKRDKETKRDSAAFRRPGRSGDFQYMSGFSRPSKARP